LAGQSQEYWAGDYTRVNEADTFSHRLLTYHPLAFVAGHGIMALVSIGLILLTPRITAIIFSIFSEVSFDRRG
jgi:hypothetical protein